MYVKNSQLTIRPLDNNDTFLKPIHIDISKYVNKYLDRSTEKDFIYIDLYESVPVMLSDHSYTLLHLLITHPHTVTTKLHHHWLMLDNDAVYYHYNIHHHRESSTTGDDCAGNPSLTWHVPTTNPPGHELFWVNTEDAVTHKPKAKHAIVVVPDAIAQVRYSDSIIF